MAMSWLIILIELVSVFFCDRIFIFERKIGLTVMVVINIEVKGCWSDGGSSFEASIVLVRILNAYFRYIKMPYCRV